MRSDVEQQGCFAMANLHKQQCALPRHMTPEIQCIYRHRGWVVARQASDRQADRVTGTIRRQHFMRSVSCAILGAEINECTT